MMSEVTRVTRSKQAARSSYNRMSGWYDLIAGSSERKFREKGLELLNAVAGEMILEAGCGTGHSLLTLAHQVGAEGRVYGLDLSEGMLGQARNRLARSEVEHAVMLQCGDAAYLPFPANSFDALFMSFALELFDTPEIPLVLAECRRVLKIGGRMGLVSLVKKNGFMVDLYEWLHFQFPVLVDCRPIFARDIIVKAGFQIVEAKDLVMWGLPMDVILACKDR